jgi:DNA-binding protein H-NS
VEVGEIPAALQSIVQEAKNQSGHLANAVAALTEETESFFGRIMKAMAGKPALAKLEQYFGSAHNNVEARLAEARQLSGNLLATLAKLEQNLGQQQVSSVSPDAQAAISSQVKTIRNAVENISQAASKLQQGLTGEAGAPSAAYEGIALKDARVDTEEFSFESDDLMEALDSDPVLDLVEEVPSEPLRPRPGTLATIYLADVANNTLGVPTEAVTNVFKLSKGKAKAIRKRGYVRLADFKGTFRSIKRGMTGPLADLKPKELKKIQFPLVGLSPEILGSDDTEAVAPVRGIVLLSTGQRHGAMLTDEVMQRTPYDVKGYQKAGLPGEVSGTATIEGDFEINVIDPDYLLS